MLNWFRAHRRKILVIAVAMIVSLALLRYVCPWPTGNLDASGTDVASSAAHCGPQDCTFASIADSAGGEVQMAPSPSTASIAAFFFAIASVVVFAVAAALRLPFVRRSTYPPILEFYRLRI